MLTLRRPADVEARLEDLARRTGRSTSFYAREALLEHLEDLEDLCRTEQAAASTSLRWADRLDERGHGDVRSLSYVVVWSTRSEMQLAELDEPVARAVVRFMSERPSTSTTIPDTSAGNRAAPALALPRGDCRMLCLIQDQEIVVLVVEVCHRREVCR